jgi:hypothetical protein
VYEREPATARPARSKKGRTFLSIIDVSSHFVAAAAERSGAPATGAYGYLVGKILLTKSDTNEIEKGSAFA